MGKIKKYILCFSLTFILLILSSLVYGEGDWEKETIITEKNVPDKFNYTINETKIQNSLTGNVVFSEKPNELQKIYSKSLPSIVKINVYYTYDIFIPKPNSIEFKYGFDSNYPLYEDLSVRMDKNTNGLDYFFGDSFWEEFYPGDYYTLDEFGQTYKFELTLQDIIDIKKEYYLYNNGSLPLFGGTGFIINPEGYIITNAHVATLVDSEMEDMKEIIKTSNYLDYYYVLYYNAAYNKEISQKDYEDYLKKTIYLEENLNISNIKISRINVVLGDGLDAKEYEAKLIDSNKYYLDELGGRDWALLKIEGDNFPSLPLGNSDNLPIGEDIVVIGYPWTSEGTTEQDKFYVAATPTYGKISNIIPSGNYRDIQIDVSIEEGNSGGPALNTIGEVIGIATSGYEGLSGVYNYLTPIDDIKKELSIIAKQSEIDYLWNEGLEEFWNENYVKARSNFEEIKLINENHPYVQEILKQLDSLPYTNKETVSKNDKKPNSQSSTEEKSISFVAIIFITLGIIIIVLLSFIAIRLFKNNEKRLRKK